MPTRPLSENQKSKELPAFNVIFMLETGKHKFIPVPANFCGTTFYTRVKKMLKKGREVSRHFNDDDKICPKNFTEVLFLGPKVRAGKTITFPEPYTKARLLEPGKKYPVAEIRLRHGIKN